MKSKNKIKEEYLPGYEVQPSEIRDLVLRIEAEVDARKAINTSIAELYKNAESMGLNPRVLRELIRMRSMDEHKRDDIEGLLPRYMKACNTTCNDVNSSLLSCDDAAYEVVTNGKIPANSRRFTY